MSNILRSFRLRVHNRGESDPTDLTVDFTIGLDALAAPPVLPGPIVRIFEGRTETQSWNFDVIDSASVITSRLATAGGRMHLLGRIVQVQMQEDGGAWETIGTARLANLSQSQGPGRYSLSLEDERWKERNTFVFTRSDTTSLWPQGLRYPFRRYPTVEPASCRVERIVNSLVVLRPRTSSIGRLPARYKVTRAVQDLILADVQRDTTLRADDVVGSFATLRAHCDGVEREIWAWTQTRDGQFVSLTEIAGDDEQMRPFYVVWTGTLPSVNDTVEVTISAALHEPTDALPYHIGVNDASHLPWGSAGGLLHPFDALERAYIEAGVRYDPAAFATLQADSRYAKSGWRITSKRKTAEWAEEAIYQPNLVVPFIDNEGRLAPKAVHNPSDIDPDTLFVFDASNTKQPHVTWHHGAREAYNVLSVEYEEERYIPGEPSEGRTLPTDRIDVRDRSIVREHDTVDDLTARTLTVRMDGLHRGSGSGIIDFAEDLLVPQDALLRDNATRAADDLFEVAGDGPQSGTIHGMLSTASVAAGDLVILDQGALKNPNPAANARSGERIVRILQRTSHVDGYEYEYLDVGPKLQPLAAPTIAIAQNADYPRNAVDITVSNVPAGAKVTVLIATDSGLTEVSRHLNGVDAGVHTVRGLPPGATIYAGGYAHMVGRIRSVTSAVVSVALDAPAPMVKELTLTHSPDGTVLAEWEVNPHTPGIRLHHNAHSAGVDPVLADPVDVDASLGEYTFAASLITAEQFSVGATPYPGFSGGAVSGTAGEQVVRTVAMPQDEFPDPFGKTEAHVGGAGELLLNASGNEAGVSFKYAASKTAFPSTPATTVDSRESLDVDTGLVLAEGETGYVAVWWYPGASGGGTQGQRVTAQVTRGATAAAADVVINGITPLQAVNLDDRYLEASIKYQAGVVSLQISYGDTQAETVPVEGTYIRNVAAGPATLLEIIKEGSAAAPYPIDPTVDEIWPDVSTRAPMQLTVRAYDGANGTGNLLDTDVLGSDFEADVVGTGEGGTGLSSVPVGAIMLGTGTDPFETMVGSATTHVPVWNGSKFAARQLGFADLSGSVASAQVPQAAVTQHQAALAINVSQLGGVLNANKGGTGLQPQNADAGKLLQVAGFDSIGMVTPLTMLEQASVYTTPGTGNRSLVHYNGGGYGWELWSTITGIGSYSIFDLADVANTLPMSEGDLLAWNATNARFEQVGTAGFYTKTESDGRYPLKNGTGASGTWGISVTGSAGSVPASGITGSTFPNTAFLIPNGSLRVGDAASTIGGIGLQAGTSTQIGYLQFWTPAGVRQGYIGWGTAGINVNMENGQFVINGEARFNLSPEIITGSTVATQLRFLQSGVEDWSIGLAAGAAGFKIRRSGVTSLEITSSGTFPGADNARTLGGSGVRWSTIYGVHGNFTGSVSLTDTLTAGSITVSGTANLNGATLNFGDTLVHIPSGFRLYAAAGAYWYSESSNGWQIRNTASATQGFLYFDTSGFGLLNSAGSWRVRTTTSGSELFGTITLHGNVFIDSTSNFYKDALLSLYTTGGAAQGMKIGSLVISDSYSDNAPSTSLLVKGAAQFRGATGPASGVGLELGYNASGSYLQSYNRDLTAYQAMQFIGSQMHFYIGGAGGTTEHMRLHNNGNLTLGTTSDAGYKLRVNGAGYYDGSLTCASTLVVSGVLTASGGISTSGISATNIGVNGLLEDDTYGHDYAPVIVRTAAQGFDGTIDARVGTIQFVSDT